MNIYLDGMFYQCSGVGRVIDNLLAAMIGSGAFGRIRTVVPEARKEAFQSRFSHPCVSPAFVPHGPMSLWDLTRKGSFLKGIGKDVSLFLFPSHNAPLGMRGRYVMTMNDVTVLSSHSSSPWLERALFRAILSRTLRGANRVVAISGATRDALAREFALPADKIAVFYPWVDDKFFRRDDAGIARRRPVDGDYLLYLGLRIAHKNLDGIVKAFLLLTDDFPGLRLVIAGGRYREADIVDRVKSDPRFSGRLVEIVDPTDEQVLDLLAGAKAFVFPSFAEGFGLPPLEAMASGVPVVCSDIPVFREVYGDAAVFADPRRPDSIAQGIRAVLSDRDLAARLVAMGRERASLYGRERSMAAYLGWLGELGGPVTPSRVS